MADTTRKKNLGFKPKGKDPIHDKAYTVLEVLPRGTLSDVVALAINEYIDNHNGVISVAGRRNVIIVKADGGDMEEAEVQPESRQGSSQSGNSKRRIDISDDGQGTGDVVNAGLSQKLSTGSTDVALERIEEMRPQPTNTPQVADATAEAWLGDDELIRLIAGWGK